VLGDLRAKSAMHRETRKSMPEWCDVSRNPYNKRILDWVAFFDVDECDRSVTGDRSDF